MDDDKVMWLSTGMKASEESKKERRKEGKKEESNRGREE